MPLDARHVYCGRADRADYGPAEGAAPELPRGTPVTQALLALRRAMIDAGLDAAHVGAPDWNPFAELIGEGRSVLLKPNWVLHHNKSGAGMDCLVTHASLIEATLHYVAKTRPRQIVLGDAPLQGCDLDALRQQCGIEEMLRRVAAPAPVSVCDFRRTILPGGRAFGKKREDCRPLENYVLYDLKSDSLLEPITKPNVEFRVTVYNPDVLRSHHAPGRHQYLVAREVADADVVISLPKLKTHKKACITGALKNMVGINGHKEYLPHHRRGGSESGGDCYGGCSRHHDHMERLLDAANRAESPWARYGYWLPYLVYSRLCRVLRRPLDLEGSWYGNDTVWRTCLDLQRILFHGRPDGTLADTPARQVVTITDAIVAGDGEGPLSPSPVPLGLVTLGVNGAALEWCHALLMGLDPQRIPITREAFFDGRWPLADFSPEQIVAHADGIAMPPAELAGRLGKVFRPPTGWRGHCERVRE